MNQNSRNRNNRSSLEIILLFILAGACLFISLVQTAIGFEFANPPFNWILSGVIIVLLMLLNIRFNDHLRRNMPVWGILIMFVIVISGSFIGNFNAFYSRFMRTELYEVELREFRNELDGLKQRAITELNASNDAEALRSRVEQLRDNLVVQITDPGNPGIGDRAKEIIQDINNELDIELTILEGNGDPNSQARAMSNQINNLIDKEAEKRAGDANELIKEVKMRADTVRPEIEYTLSTNERLEDLGKSTLDKVADAYNRIGEITKNFLGADVFPFETKKIRNDQVGKISETFESVQRRDNPQATWISAAASLAVDLLLPLYIFFTGRNSDEEDNNNSRKSGPNQVNVLQ